MKLPEPSAAAQAHSERVAARLRALIEAAGGSIPFERFMEAALYAPALGYYSAGAAKFGAAGDFVTAPTISPLFARCIARQANEVLHSIGGGEVLEFGAGDGTLAAAAIEALAAAGAPCRAYLVLERSADLRSRQRARLERAPGTDRIEVRWLDALPAEGFEGVMIANEVLDAFAAARFEIDGGRASELHVALDAAGAFAWACRPARPALARALDALLGELDHGRPPGAALWTALGEGGAYRSELNLQAQSWIGELGARLARGVALLVDYGYPRHEYYHPDRRSGTLRCHYRHHAIDDPFLLPGLIDITAHVDFTQVARAGLDSGLDLAGFTTQKDFLLALGVLDEAARLEPGSRDFVELTAQIKRLTFPGEMGESTKVMALARGLDRGGACLALAGFRGRDHRRRLGLARGAVPVESRRR